MSCLCDPETERRYSCYYDTPDGQDIPTKTLVTTRYGVVTGFALATYDAMMYSHATRFPHILQRYTYHCGHLGLMGATFALVANGMQLWREKDDQLNYFIGGLACGPILASYLGSKHAVLMGGLFLGAIAMVKKEAIMNKWEFFPRIQPHMNHVDSWRHDYSLAHDPRLDLIATCGLEKEPAKPCPWDPNM